MQTTLTLPGDATETLDTFTADRWIDRAGECFQAEDLSGARDALCEALTASPDRVDVMIFLGNVLFHLDDLEGARRQFAHATILAPDDVSAQLSLAAVLGQLGRAAEAESIVRSALTYQSGHTGAIKFLASLCLQDGRFGEAADLYARYLAREPMDVEAWLCQGRCFFESGQATSAARSYETALRLDPSNALAKENLAVVRERVAATAPVGMVRAVTDGFDLISARDEMFTGNREHYFRVGRSALECIDLALRAAGRAPEEIHRILDLPCGHGRVMRVLQKAFPQAHLDGCDLNRDGVDFCHETFGASPIYSAVDISQIPLAGPYDLIWCGSLLTHLTAEQCGRFVDLFNRALRPGGVLLFSTHGRWAAQNLATGRYKYCLGDESVQTLLQAYHATGFGYVDYPNQGGYGISLSHPSYVCAQWADAPDFKLVSFIEKGWDNHQDVVALQKLSDTTRFD